MTQPQRAERAAQPDGSPTERADPRPLAPPKDWTPVTGLLSSGVPLRSHLAAPADDGSTRPLRRSGTPWPPSLPRPSSEIRRAPMPVIRRMDDKDAKEGTYVRVNARLVLPGNWWIDSGTLGVIVNEEGKSAIGVGRTVVSLMGGEHKGSHIRIDARYLDECDPHEDQRRTFSPLKDGEGNEVSIGNTRTWKVGATREYHPSGPMEVPGSTFSDVLPGQDHVNRRVVEAKIKAGLPGKLMVPVTIDPQGRVVLGDKHHGFVAAMALGLPVTLALRDMTSISGMNKTRTDWRSTTWEDFDKPPNAIPGFELSPLESKVYEGEIAPVKDWDRIVPWRKGRNSTDQQFDAVDAILAKLSTKMHWPLYDACRASPGLTGELFELLCIDGIKVALRKPENGSSGGDWDPDKKTIYIDNNLGPDAMLDMLLFEEQNARRRGDYRKLQSESHEQRSGIQDFGVARGSIEADGWIEYLGRLISMRNRGLDLSESGRKALAQADEHVPGYSTMTPEARAKQYDKLVAMVLATPHGGANATLPNRLALTTSELYAYEKISDTMQLKGTLAYFCDVYGLKYQTRNELSKSVEAATGSKTAPIAIDRKPGGPSVPPLPPGSKVGPPPPPGGTGGAPPPPGASPEQASPAALVYHQMQQSLAGRAPATPRGGTQPYAKPQALSASQVTVAKHEAEQAGYRPEGLDAVLKQLEK